MSSTPNPIELTLKTGEVIKAADATEGLKTAVKMIEDNKDYAHAQKERADALEAEVRQLNQQFQQVQQKVNATPVPGQPPQAQIDEYWKKANQNPFEATAWALGVSLGLDNPSEVTAVMRKAINDVEIMNQQVHAASFIQSHPQFPGGQDVAALLTNRVKELRDTGFPVNDLTMDMAYRQLVEQGKIKPLEVTKQEADEPPPSMSGSGAQIDSEMQKAENMTDEDLRKFLISKGMLS